MRRKWKLSLCLQDTTYWRQYWTVVEPVCMCPLQTAQFNKPVRMCPLQTVLFNKPVWMCPLQTVQFNKLVWMCPLQTVQFNKPVWMCPLQTVLFNKPVWTCPLQTVQFNKPVWMCPFQTVQFNKPVWMCPLQTIQFSTVSIIYVLRKSMHAIHPISQKFPWRCFWNQTADCHHVPPPITSLHQSLNIVVHSDSGNALVRTTPTWKGVWAPEQTLMDDLPNFSCHWADFVCVCVCVCFSPFVFLVCMVSSDAASVFAWESVHHSSKHPYA